MADFVAVLRKTIGTLGENTPEMREKVYEKARSTIEAKLAAINPPPPVAVVDRQRKALEDAIAVVRAEFDAQPEAPADSDLEDIFASLRSMGEVKPPAPVTPAVTPEQVYRPAVPVAPVARGDVSQPSPVREEPRVAEPQAPVPPPAASARAARPDPVLDLIEPAGERDVPAADPVARPERPRRPKLQPSKSPRFGAIAAAAAAVLLVGGGLAYWLMSDNGVPPASPVAEAPTEEGASSSEELAETAPAEDAEAPAEDVAEVSPEPAAPSPAPVTPSADEPKFTQRLLADGTEVDEGPAGGPRSIGEGTSVAALVPPAEGTPAAPQQGAAADAPQQQAQQAPQNTEPATPAVAVGQRAIFYEERTSSAQGSAEMGSIVWSVVQESPGGDGPPEPAIRAEATVPGKDIQLRMTIRRNGDQTLPASHIVEMIFLTPDGFEGGSISSVSRIAFKETEQAAGSALVGIPAKIADGFFLIALGDTPAEIEANMNLLRRQSWIDIPIVYQTGRRALLTIEKGIPGERVFEEALRAWGNATSG